MESNHSNGFVDDETSKQLNSPHSTYLNGINGEPEIVPRVGDQYQADIPVLVSEHDRLNLVKCFKSESLITFGLPIPLMWARSEKFKGSFLESSEYEKPSPLSDEREPEPLRKSNRRSVVLALPCQRNVKLKFDKLDDILYPFPGTLGESWEASEKERFLLALYCLGKNLVLVQRFVGSKKMGDILSYYYGSFYRSNEYRRWEDGRKSRTRRSSVQGQKLFTGWRLQELLSRISSNVSEECKSMLLKVSKEFREEKITVEEFVFTLKEAVGIDLFTEAIGIGKGKKDLTNSAVEPTAKNSSEVVRIRNDLPVSDIVKFLTGEYRMSKTKSCDLFWEAVWPRLLARGWHSEQPKDGPRNSLVFLIPEANNFSRRKMSKGRQYFDSLTDVLNRVRLDPSLLELKTDEEREKESREEDIIKTVEETPEFDDSSPNGKRKKRYLQPRSKQPSKINQEVTMFTIMDTSSANGALKELRSLPVEIRSSVSESEDNNLSEESENKVDTTRASRVCGGGGSISSGKSMDNASTRSTILLNERQEKPKKNKGGRPKNPVCAKRSSVLADCTLREESGCFGETQFQKKKKKKSNTSEEADDDQNERSNQDQTLKLSSEDDSLCRRKQEERGMSSSSQEPERRPEKAREDFDLNVSQIDHEADGDDTVITTEVVQNSESSCAEQSSVQMDVEKQQVTVDLLPEPRRQSTRARPLTTKALEAIAFGYLGNSKKKKRKDSEEESRSNKSRTKRISRSHSVVLSSEFRNGIVEDGSNTDDDE